MRIAFFELGKIHHGFGFLAEAIKSWARSHDFSTSEEDLFNVSFAIAQAAFENQSSAYLSKYAGEADARDKLKNPAKTIQVKALDALSCLQQDNFKDTAIRLANISITDEQALSEMVQVKDLAFYVTLCSLQSLTRSEIKTHILSASGFKNLMESMGDGSNSTVDVIENFLNGRYMDFQRQIASIAAQLKFDLYFGHRLTRIMKDIRKKAIVQYVTPYKVIDMREIAKAFDLPIDKVEAEIAELIVSKQIQAKIDSNSKLLYSRKDNETMNSYKEAVELGRKFIQETEAALLRVQVHQKKLALKPVQQNISK